MVQMATQSISNSVSQVCSLGLSAAKTLETPRETQTGKHTIHRIIPPPPDTDSRDLLLMTSCYNNKDFATQSDAEVKLVFLPSADHKIWGTGCC